MRGSIVIVLALIACGEVKKSSIDVDAPPTGEADASPDTPDAPGTDAATPVQRPGAIASTSGGGTVISSGHRARIRIGAPQPAGRSASATHDILTGPGALP